MAFQEWNGQRTKWDWDLDATTPLVLVLPLPPPSPPLHRSEKETSAAIPIRQAMLTMAESGGGLDQLKVEDDRSGSECCSGCQSGWTHYLEQSQSLPPRTDSTLPDDEEDGEDDDEEDDLSMLSDASSGPAHVPNDEENCCSSFSDGGGGFPHLTQVPDHGSKRRRVEEEEEDDDSDSASSTLFSISKDITSNSRGSKKLLQMEDEHSSFSATRF